MQRFNLSTLAALLVNASIATAVRPEQRVAVAKAPDAKRRTTSRNYEQQKAAYEAAEAKRLRKQSKRLADAGMDQGELL